MEKKTVMTGLAIAFVVSFAAMVVSAYCADYVFKSACITTDEQAKKAYNLSWMAAVVEGLVALGAAGTMVFLIFYHHGTRGDEE